MFAPPPDQVLGTPASAAEPLVLVLADPALVPMAPDPCVRVFDSLPALLAALDTLAPTAVVVPRAALRRLPAGLRGTARVVYGGDGTFEDRTRARGQRATTYFEGAVALDAVVRAIWALPRGDTLPERILVVGATASIQGTWERASASWRAEVFHARTNDDALTMLEALRPTLLVLATPASVELLTVLDAHPSAPVVPRVILSDRPIFGVLEQTLPATLDPEHLGVLIGVLLARGRRERALRAHEPWTGALSPAAFHTVLRSEVAARRRSEAWLTVVSFAHEPSQVGAVDMSAAGLAQGLLGRVLFECVRTSDIVGELGPGQYAVAFRGSQAWSLDERLRQIEERFLARCEDDPRLRGARLSLGVSEVTALSVDPITDAEQDRLARLGIGPT